ncbi:MAG: hypothetical protein HY517_04230 [Candidatus Aenigmarchaeota archaeon]|nr:hypothetical protein [Candidatus Aenigmarchaeota archaeon]
MRLHYELAVLVLAVALAGAFSYDFSRTPSISITGLPTANTPPVGAFDSATCDVLTGWARDPDEPDKAINVHVYRDGPAGSGTWVGAFAASETGGAAGGPNGFRITTPDSLKDLPRRVFIHAIDSTNPRDGPNPVIGEKTMPSCGTCNVKFTSNKAAQFTLKRNGAVVHNDQGVSAGATTSLALDSGEWDMVLEQDSVPSGFRYDSVTPRGAQNCPVGGEVLWTWRFVSTTAGGEQPPDFGGSGGSSSYRLQLRRGWNLVSLPTGNVQSFSSLQNNCNYVGGPWVVRNGQSFEYSNSINSLEGFFISVSSDCTVTVPVTQITASRTLRPGWNIVGFTETKTINDIRGTCTFAAGPKWWNPTTTSLELPNTVEIGKGYAIGVRNQCTLSSTGTGAPDLGDSGSSSGSCNGITGSITCNGQGSCNFNSGQTVRIAWTSSGADSCVVNSAGSTVWTGTSNGYGTTPGNTQAFTLRCTRAGSSCDVASVTATLQGS